MHGECHSTGGGYIVPEATSSGSPVLALRAPWLNYPDFLISGRRAIYEELPQSFRTRSNAEWREQGRNRSTD